MGKIDYKSIYNINKQGWYAMTEEPQKYEALLAGHYSDSNHFVYELLQNAEDAFEVNSKGVFDEKTCTCANKVVIEYYSDKLIFYHNGKPFDENDVKGVSSMLMGTKNKDDAQTIGRFGMGFKSVFKYTYQPEIYSDDEAFKITRYLLPVEIVEGWNYENEKKTIVCKRGDKGSFHPFINEKHLTKIVIPFKKYGRNGSLVDIPGDDILKKLDEIDGSMLLFLSHIQNLYWVNKETGKYAFITLKHDDKDEKMVICSIEGTSTDGKEEITKYLKFKSVFNHRDMSNSEVSVAYKLNSRGDKIIECANSFIWVYFPTRDKTDLPFLIHGSFETAVSREKLMTPSSFNNDLFDELGNLIANSMEELATRQLITQTFIRRIIFGAFEDEEKNGTIQGLKEKVTNTIKEKGLIPDKNGTYRAPETMYLPIPFRIGDFVDKPLIENVIGNRIFVAFNNENEKYFTQYFNWLKDKIGIKIYGLSDLTEDLKLLEGVEIPASGIEYDSLRNFYDFLSDNRESLYLKGTIYSRSDTYHFLLRGEILNAWKKLREVPIILSSLRVLVPAKKKGEAVVYMSSSSEYMSLNPAELVDKSIACEFKDLLSDEFKIKEFNNYQYIKEKVINKYIGVENSVCLDGNDAFLEGYFKDLKQILGLMKDSRDFESVRELTKKARIIKVKNNVEDNKFIFAKPEYCFVPESKEGINLNIYFHPVIKVYLFKTREISFMYDFEVKAIDSEFYEENGISISELSKLGLITSPIIEGRKSSENGIGDNYWIALGEFCPEIAIYGLEDNLIYIEKHSDQDIAKKKSVEILKVLLRISRKLQGQKRHRKNNPYFSGLLDAEVLWKYIRGYKWLYNKKMKVCSPGEMSRYELNTSMYKDLHADKTAYEIIGFIENEADKKVETFEKAANLDVRDKKLLVKQLARELGMQVTDIKKNDYGEESDESFFNPNIWKDEQFPVNKVNNIDYLIRHVREQFFCADPITYKKVLRQIRISKNDKNDRSYAIGMYTNSSNVHICQMCKKTIDFMDVLQIANFGIEMPQLNLCLCRECASKYKAIRDANKEEYKKMIRLAIMSLESEKESDDYSIKFNEEMILHFTQTHLAEIQEIFRLIDEYGLPHDDEI